MAGRGAEGAAVSHELLTGRGGLSDLVTGDNVQTQDPAASARPTGEV